MYQRWWIVCFYHLLQLRRWGECSCILHTLESKFRVVYINLALELVGRLTFNGSHFVLFPFLDVKHKTFVECWLEQHWLSRVGWSPVLFHFSRNHNWSLGLSDLLFLFPCWDIKGWNVWGVSVQLFDSLCVAQLVANYCFLRLTWASLTWNQMW